jgi:hypothetical protein
MSAAATQPPIRRWFDRQPVPVRFLLLAVLLGGVALAITFGFDLLVRRPVGESC